MLRINILVSLTQYARALCKAALSIDDEHRVSFDHAKGSPRQSIDNLTILGSNKYSNNDSPTTPQDDNSRVAKFKLSAKQDSITRSLADPTHHNTAS